MVDYYTLNWVPQDVKKIAYATSFGIGSIPAKYSKIYSHYLKRIDYLSARETSGQDIIKKLAGRDVQLVNDPALLLDADGWNEVISNEPLIKEKYVFCYFMGNNPEQRDFVRRLANEKGLKVVALLHLDQYIASDENYVDMAPWHEFGQECRMCMYGFLPWHSIQHYLFPSFLYVQAFQQKGFSFYEYSNYIFAYPIGTDG